MQVYRRSKAKWSKFLLSIIACNESSISHDDPESKQPSSVWKKKRLPRPRKSRQVPLIRKVMVIQFSNIKGVTLQHWIPQQQSVNAKHGAETFRDCFAECIKNKKHILDTTIFCCKATDSHTLHSGQRQNQYRAVEHL